MPTFPPGIYFSTDNAGNPTLPAPNGVSYSLELLLVSGALRNIVRNANRQIISYTENDVNYTVSYDNTGLVTSVAKT